MTSSSPLLKPAVQLPLSLRVFIIRVTVWASPHVLQSSQAVSSRARVTVWVAPHQRGARKWRGCWDISFLLSVKDEDSGSHLTQCQMFLWKFPQGQMGLLQNWRSGFSSDCSPGSQAFSHRDSRKWNLTSHGDCFRIACCLVLFLGSYFEMW